METLGWVILGAIAGIIAKLNHPRRQDGGIFTTVLLGILGALVGREIANYLPVGLPSMITALIGAVLMLSLWGLIFRRTL
jgi:uncharacterized membrane protein YeaQ/YmgE (transglycosylase-associated protein family)